MSAAAQALRSAAADALQRLWLVTRFGCCVQVFHDYVVEATVCVGPSMLPSFNTGGGDIVLCEVKRGEVVVSSSPTNARQTVCKRVLGLGGDVIRVPHVDRFGNISEREEKVPPHHVWLQGDNTRNSNDSRHYGAVPVAMLRGRVCYRVWPLRQVGPIRAEPERCRIVTPGAEQLSAARHAAAALPECAAGSPAPFGGWDALAAAAHRVDGSGAAADRTHR